MDYFSFVPGLALGAGFAIALMVLKLKQAYQKGRGEAAVVEERLRNSEKIIEELKSSFAKEMEKTRALDEALREELRKFSAAEQQCKLIPDLEERLKEKNKLAEDLNSRNSSLSVRIAELETIISKERSENAEKIKILDESKEKLTEAFKNLANEIFEEKSKKFTEHNKLNLEALLNPLGLKIKEFEKKVEDTHEKSVRDSSALMEKISQLQELNKQLSSDATDLTRALKGEAKTQGNWGELILERILEVSGLEKDIEYEKTPNCTEDGRRYQPDVIVKLPEGKHIIIDAKVSLTAYERYCSAEDETLKSSSLNEHIFSVRKHIQELSAKNYQGLRQLKSPDFVLMFIPVESAFALAVRNETALFTEAIEKNIVIVTPSTLLATLRIISHIWKQEKQNRNAAEIARQSGQLYDKFLGFLKDMEGIGTRLDQAQKSYSEAMNKLKTGRGNLIRKAEEIRLLGAKEKVRLPGDLTAEAMENDDEVHEKNEHPA